MPIDAARVDLVIQCALLAAGEEDDRFDRQLGPIHLIKYVYLADLAHARDNEGVTFTGTDWTFHKFGPWSQSVNERVDPCLRAIGAHQDVFQSDYEDRADWSRWSLQDDERRRTLSRQLPSSIRLDLAGWVHRFGKDTASLLDFVYKTPPMLHAAPGERLDFSYVIEGRVERMAREPTQFEQLTEKRKKKLREGLRSLREKSGKTSPAEANRVVPPPAAVDDIYLGGIRWLDDKSQVEFPEGSQVADIDDEVWKSPARHGKDLS